MFKTRGGMGSKAVWTMLKKTALLVEEGFPYDLTFFVNGVYKSFISTGSNVCLLPGRKVRQYQFVAYSIGATV